MTQPKFYSQAHRFYLEEEPYLPLIKDRGMPFHKGEGFHASVISLDCRSSSELVWSSETDQAREVVENGGMIVWEFDFGMGSEKISFTDPTLFLSYTLAIEQFVKTVWQEFAQKTLGAIFFRGDLYFFHRIGWCEQKQKNFSDWHTDIYGCEKDFDQAEVHVLQLFSMTLLSEYLHRLLSYLPDSLQVFCLFDATGHTSFSRQAQLFSKERFSHFQLGVQGGLLPIIGLQWQKGECFSGYIGDEPPKDFPFINPSVALCLPGDEALDSNGLEELERVFATLYQMKVPYRIIPEALLTEEWDELESIISLSSMLSGQGRRKLQGFCAAGGEVVSYGHLMGFAEEVSFEDYLERNRSRGIRTPDLLLPKQPR